MKPMLLGLVLVAADARGHRPEAADAWWAGLGPASLDAPASGVQVLGVAPRGRVRIPAGTFVMGATPTQQNRATALCEREVRKSECHQRGFISLVRAQGMAHPVTLSSF